MLDHAAAAADDDDDSSTKNYTFLFHHKVDTKAVMVLWEHNWTLPTKHCSPQQPTPFYRTKPQLATSSMDLEQ